MAALRSTSCHRGDLPALLAAALTESVSIVATDLNQPMLEMASAIGTECA